MKSYVEYMAHWFVRHMIVELLGFAWVHFNFSGPATTVGD